MVNKSNSSLGNTVPNFIKVAFLSVKILSPICLQNCLFAYEHKGFRGLGMASGPLEKKAFKQDILS